MNAIIIKQSMEHAIDSVYAAVKGSDECCLMINENELIVAARDDMCAASASVRYSENNGILEGSYAVPMELLSKIIDDFPDVSVFISVNDRGSEIVFEAKSAAKASYKVSVIPDRDIDVVKRYGDEKPFVVAKCDQIASAFMKVFFAAGKKDARAWLNGVYLTTEGGKLLFMASDSYRLVAYSDIDALNDASVNIFIDRRIVDSIVAFLRKRPASTDVTLFTNNNSLFVDAGDGYVLSSPLGEVRTDLLGVLTRTSSFYTDSINDKSASCVALDILPPVWLRAAESLSFANDNFSVVSVSVKNGAASFAARRDASKLSDRALCDAVVEIPQNGDHCEFAVKLQFLDDMLRAFYHCNKLQVFVAQQGDAPLLFRCCGERDDSPQFHEALLAQCRL